MPRLENGFVYLWALFAVVLAGIMMAGTGQMWQAKSQREKETELLFIGEEFRKAIMSYHNSGTKQYPSSLEDLLKDDRSPNIKRHLRKIYVDPMTGTAEWGIVEEPSPTANTANPPANKSPASGTTNPASGKSSASTGGSLAPGDNQTSSTANPTQAPTPTPDSTPGSGATPKASSGIGSNIGKRIIGVYSLSEKKPIKKGLFPEHIAKFSEALTYQDWQFVYKPGDTKKPSAPGSAKSDAASATNPFAPQSSSTSSTAPAKGASPFSSPSSSTSGSKAPATGFSSGQ